MCVSPEGKEGLLCVARHSCSDGQHEGDDAKGGVDWYKACPEFGGALLTAEQDPEAKEPDNKLKAKHSKCESEKDLSHVVVLPIVIQCLPPLLLTSIRGVHVQYALYLLVRRSCSML